MQMIGTQSIQLSVKEKTFYILPHSAGAFKHLKNPCEATEIQPVAWKLKQKMKKVSVLRKTLIFAVAVVGPIFPFVNKRCHF